MAVHNMIDTFEHIKLDQTCVACPEQYDVYYKGELIGYIRYRYGRLEVHPIVVGKYLFDQNIVKEQIEDQYDGVLPDDLRIDILKLCITKIVEYHNNLERATVEEKELSAK